jgi:hypothetical protein
MKKIVNCQGQFTIFNWSSVRPKGFEPLQTAPKAVVLSVTLRALFTTEGDTPDWFFVRLEGLEPPTYSSVGCRSIQLSYRRNEESQNQDFTNCSLKIGKRVPRFNHSFLDDSSTVKAARMFCRIDQPVPVNVRALFRSGLASFLEHDDPEVGTQVSALDITGHRMRRRERRSC